MVGPNEGGRGGGRHAEPLRWVSQVRKKRVEHCAQGEQGRKWVELGTHIRKISLLPMVGLRPILLNSGSLERDDDRETLTFSTSQL